MALTGTSWLSRTTMLIQMSPARSVASRTVWPSTTELVATVNRAPLQVPRLTAPRSPTVRVGPSHGKAKSTGDCRDEAALNKDGEDDDHDQRFRTADRQRVGARPALALRAGSAGAFSPAKARTSVHWGGSGRESSRDARTRAADDGQEQTEARPGTHTSRRANTCKVDSQAKDERHDLG